MIHLMDSSEIMANNRGDDIMDIVSSSPPL